MVKHMEEVMHAQSTLGTGSPRLSVARVRQGWHGGLSRKLRRAGKLCGRIKWAGGDQSPPEGGAILHLQPFVARGLWGGGGQGHGSSDSLRRKEDPDSYGISSLSVSFARLEL